MTGAITTCRISCAKCWIPRENKGRVLESFRWTPEEIVQMISVIDAEESGRGTARPVARFDPVRKIPMFFKKLIAAIDVALSTQNIGVAIRVAPAYVNSLGIPERATYKYHCRASRVSRTCQVQRPNWRLRDFFRKDASRRTARLLKQQVRTLSTCLKAWQASPSCSAAKVADVPTVSTVGYSERGPSGPLWRGRCVWF